MEDNTTTKESENARHSIATAAEDAIKTVTDAAKAAAAVIVREALAVQEAHAIVNKNAFDDHDSIIA